MASNLVRVKSGHDMKCGHQEPSEEVSSSIAKSPIVMDNQYQVILKEDNSATLTIKDQTFV